MSGDVLLTLTILGIAVVLFVTEWLRADITAVLSVVALNLTGLITTREAVAGFGSSAVITIGSLLVIGNGLVRSGVVNAIANRLHRMAGNSRWRLTALSTGIPGLLSGFINIVAAVSIFIPGVLRLAKLNQRSPSRLLLPMACAGLVGANLSLIGASHNLVVNEQIKADGLVGFGFFEFTALGTVLLPMVVIYSLVFAERLLPRATQDGDTDKSDQRADLIKRFALHERLWEVWLPPRSPLAGTSLKDLAIEPDYGITVLALTRGDNQYPVDNVPVVLQADDVLLLGGRRDRVEALTEEHTGLVLLGEPHQQNGLPVRDAELIEIAVAPHGRAVGRSLSELRLREKTGLTGVALWRDGSPTRTDVGDYPLQPGDGLLLFGPRRRTRSFEPMPDFLWLQAPPEEEAPPELRRLALPATLIFLGIILSAAFGLADIATLTLLGAALMVMIGLLSARQAYQAIDWRTLVLIGAMLPMGTALKHSGAADAIAGLLVDSLGNLGPLAVMLGLAVAAMAFTQPLHNAVVAVVLTPVALNTADALGANPRAFALAVLVGASANFLLPVGHPAPLLVKDAGGYRIRDYLRFGLGLNLLTLAVIALVIPWLWPLTQSG